MKIYFIIIATGIACYFVGILIGRKTAKCKCDQCREVFIDVDQDEIQHVGYTPEQCGYDK